MPIKIQCNIPARNLQSKSVSTRTITINIFYKGETFCDSRSTFTSLFVWYIGEGVVVSNTHSIEELTAGGGGVGARVGDDLLRLLLPLAAYNVDAYDIDTSDSSPLMVLR